MRTQLPCFLFLTCLLLCVGFQPAKAQNLGALVCQATERRTTGSWRYYRRIYGGGQFSHRGTHNVACRRGGFWEVNAASIKRFSCKSGYQECSLVDTIPVDEVSPGKDGRISFTYNKDSWMTYTPDEKPKAGNHSFGRPPVPEGMFDPYDGRWSTREEWDEWFEQYAETVNAELVHYFDRNGGNACIGGEIFASYSIRYGDDHKIVYDYIYNAISTPLVDPVTLNSGAYTAEMFEPLADPKTTHCYKIEYARGSTGFADLPRWWRRDRVSGTINSFHTGIQYKVQGSEVVEMTMLKACCDPENYRCIGYVRGDEKCPQGVSKTGVLGDGRATPCVMCLRPDPIEVVIHEPQEESPLVGCCMGGGSVNKKDAQSCAVSGGLPLEGEASCPSSGENPCTLDPSPSPTSSPQASPSPEPVPEKMPGACLLKGNDCVDVESREECTALPNYMMFLDGGRCEASQEGGCCERDKACFESTKSECGGEFFSGGCPSACPDTFGACFLYCDSTNLELCEHLTESECKKIPSARFEKGNYCLFRSGTLECNESCGGCTAAVGIWDTKGGKYYFNSDCSGFVIQPGQSEGTNFSYDCTDNSNVNVYYEGKQGAHGFRVETDGPDHRELHER